MSASNISLDQHQLLTKIGQYTEANRRTDRLAECMKQFGKHWENGHTAFIGLQLRSLGWATTFKDSSQYARWDITPLGKAVLMELRNMGKSYNPTKLEAPVTVPSDTEHKKITNYRVIELSDGSVSEPKTLAEARKLAEKWAIDSPGNAIEIVGVLETVKAKVVIDKV